MPSVLSDHATAVDDAAAGLDTTRTQLSGAASTLRHHWEGRAAEACEHHLDREQRCIGAVVGEFEALAGLIRRAEESLSWMIRTINNAIDDAERAGFTVDDSGAITGEGVDTKPGERTAAEHADAIRTHLVGLGEIDDHYAARIVQAVSELIEVTPRAASFSPDEAAHDWKMFDDGELTGEEIGRLLSNLTAAGLDPAALADLAAGQDVRTLPTGAVQYLEDLYREGGVDGFLALHRALTDDGGPQAVAAAEALGSGVLIVSHEQVFDAGGAQGGWERLPDDVRALTQLEPSTPPAATLDEFLGSVSPFERERLESVPGAAAAAHAEHLLDPDGTYVRRVVQQNDFWAAVAASDAVPGSRLGVELVQAASAQVGLVDAPHHTPFTSTSWSAPADLGEPLLDIATRNNDVNTHILTGDLDGDGTPDTQRDDILTPLFTHDWGDDGASLGRMTSWMTDEAIGATDPSDADAVARRDQADRAALGLVQYVSHAENYTRLMDIHGSDTSDLGEANPALLHAMSSGLVGYIPHLAGIDTNSSEWTLRAVESSDDGDKRFVHAQRVFSLMSTGADANTTFMGGALTFQEAYDRQFVRSLIEPDEYGMISPNTAAAGNTAHIQALIDTGIYNAALEQTRDQENIQNLVAERRNQAYDTGYTMMRNTIASFVPTNFTAGLAMDMLNPIVRDHFTIPETPTENSAFILNDSAISAENDLRVARYLVEMNGPPSHPSAVENLTAVGILSADGTSENKYTDSVGHSVQTIRKMITIALNAEYGTDYSDNYNEEYLISYRDVAPTINFVP
ncbi:hypothetical protein ACFWCF_14000 [Rhodococcus sp. NPDC060090]|uniref:TPR repeat region-containing protein n=1 Tax=Rhodococcus sp. NPDC060090 TaxID=3347056 RepID=UPI00365E125B